MWRSTTQSERAKAAREFVQKLLDRYASYHQHKEGAAYAGVTLFAGAAGAAVVGNAWPPDWGRYTTPFAVIASTLLWAAVLTFLRFQLTRRRWAALRVAGCDRLLAAWLQRVPSDHELAPAPAEPRQPICGWSFLANCLWGSTAAVRAVATNESVYPRALVTIWLEQETRGTDALKHERLILICGWASYLALIISTLMKHRVELAV